MKSRAQNTAAKKDGRTAAELMELHFHRRLIARVFTGPTAKRWVLKGGQAMLVRWARARTSTDSDFLSDHDTVEEAVEELIAAAAERLDDEIWFRHYDTSTAVHLDRPTRTVRFKVMFGSTDLGRWVSVDVVASDHALGGPITTEPLEPAIDMDCGPWPDVRVYPIENHIADKVCAMYERRGADGIASTRYRDPVDLVLLALKAQVRGDLTHRVLHEEAARRQERGSTTCQLPEKFFVPDEKTWNSGYAKAAKDVAEIPLELRQLDAAAVLLDAFITPLLQPSPPPGNWDYATAAAWQ
ncbi:nucleotidyltransferase AbiEii toxin of type IV toxin-antitoxin system [Lentzea atacamensis]|uniref:Nucleotidyltransferase AbiEii toxin of type IV toxin-antitoxin system n=1 Tax=Lentzea atacamensis TaxID=531938 RepID=A0ABX9DW90_9PSEU|nr:nucleotidyl transferase AbiEii/AbiGii toxin family protein [Lentzea atacamensis]RAS59559.1 nucleotidyltransferase AbiEii toxin of type IV toxin-antitoxin system [Lentzea atacamensis]